MSDLDSLMQQTRARLEPLSGDDGPCGPDLEYDNAFLELTQAAEGRPETQFEKAVPPDWRAVRGQAEALLERTRDLRIALLWLRAALHLEGVPGLVAGLHLTTGLLEAWWDELHPRPEPGDDEPFARSSALAMLPLMDGGLGDLLTARLVQVKGVGEIRLRDVEIALGNIEAREGEPSYGREPLQRMLIEADTQGAGLRVLLGQARDELKRLGVLMDERFGAGSGAEHKPLLVLLNHALDLVPEAAADAASDEAVDDAAAADDGAGGGAPRAARAGISGSVTSRAEAVRAIEMVCAYLERHEPTNPAQLFLRRASSLLERNFLELLKELAPNALDDVARVVGVDPNTVGEGGQ